MKRTHNDTLAAISQRHPFVFQGKGPQERLVGDLILSPPKDAADLQHLKTLLGDNYMPGTFILAERENCPEFLFDEKVQNFDMWLRNKMESEIQILTRCEKLIPLIEAYDREYLCQDACNIVRFQTSSGLRVCDRITNQEYCDIFRKIIIFLLQGDPEKTYPLFSDFNKIGFAISKEILEKTCGYNLYQRLRQSISSGLIGLNIKDSVTTTGRLGKDAVITFDQKASLDNTIMQVRRQLTQKTQADMAIDDWKDYQQEVLETEHPVAISWFADDYIPTIFEMKFIEEQLAYNEKLTVNLVPRNGYYGNDISYEEVLRLLEDPLFCKLKSYYNKKRFMVSQHGMDLGAFNGLRITSGLLNEIEQSDILVITGARSFEMAQGLNKNVYFSGIAVCRVYSETVTGIPMESGASVFLRQVKRLPAFHNFKARSTRRFCSRGKMIPAAQYTALEYHEVLRSSSYKKMLEQFAYKEDRLTDWILQKCKEQNITLVELLEE